MGVCASRSSALGGGKTRVLAAGEILTAAAVQQHNQATGELWVVLRGHVFDLTDFAKLHPGGKAAIEQVASNPDKSDAIFDSIHGDALHLVKLKRYLVGPIVATQWSGYASMGFPKTAGGPDTSEAPRAAAAAAASTASAAAAADAADSDVYSRYCGESLLKLQRGDSNALLCLEDILSDLSDTDTEAESLPAGAAPHR
ncbi:hypothetical protein JKP88DRAFT_268809 [Tribonema minus]|uniref:Cytochrome b5 heme-binding domain-containing protein n=1 Tax=Tribonema minus TaxID=303371 RepID=A0A835YW38_9STRA|nr:hypothetical protein JKP88DRAFT_268809 [Tribonema minus]